MAKNKNKLNINWDWIIFIISCLLLVVWFILFFVYLWCCFCGCVFGYNIWAFKHGIVNEKIKKILIILIKIRKEKQNEGKYESL
ncbi:hypothetical protein SKUN_00734 [Spiroplasma kunkelii CR2-3x]|uniref:Uncharacterized protein n=1 Tax=Spiroplasma kunkelii CR2-3x TaxID=273035 RepID=A0A0K2JG99_SPIKU|nr:hypothetical protein SKUN_00734 [Spiroplasma kunkelii CR2-3x]